jgi:hypothetical protein
MGKWVSEVESQSISVCSVTITLYNPPQWSQLQFFKSVYKHPSFSFGCYTYPEYQAMLSDLARDLNPHRPGRYEPRVVKRRPKPFARMQQPRQVLRKQLVRA